MANVQIVGVYAVNADMQDQFFDLWDADFASSEVIADILEKSTTEMTRIDHPTKPYYPNSTEEPDTELWLYQHPQKEENTHHMIGLFMDVVEQPNGSFSEVPRKWLFGRDVTALVIYKKGCCSEYSVMLCGEFEDGFEFTIRDSITTKEAQKELFANSVAYDETGEELAHAYGHVKNHDKKCNHKHKPKTKSLGLT